MSKTKGNSVGTDLGDAVREICYLLALLFCTLRACGIINWSWFWIMSPIFFSWGAALVALVAVYIIAFAVIKKEKHNGYQTKSR